MPPGLISDKKVCTAWVQLRGCLFYSNLGIISMRVEIVRIKSTDNLVDRVKIQSKNLLVILKFHFGFVVKLPYWPAESKKIP